MKDWRNVIIGIVFFVWAALAIWLLMRPFMVEGVTFEATAIAAVYQGIGIVLGAGAGGAVGIIGARGYMAGRENKGTQG